MTVLRIATRKSALALWQTEHVAYQLRAMHPGLEVELLPLSTRGDEVLDRSLAAVGGKGLFLKELEEAMLRGEADLAVHSFKDVPMQLEGPFEIAAVLERADPLDAWVSNHYDGWQSLPTGAVVGTSSLRRRARLRSLRSDIEVRDLRGNVNTRLAKLDAGEYDAIILACAGLKRLGFESRIRQRLPADMWLPAVSQGAIAVEIRAGDVRLRELLSGLDHALTRSCVEAERSMNRALEGSCQVPIAGYCEVVSSELWLRAWVGNALTGEFIQAESRGSISQADALGTSVAEQLFALGAADLLAQAAEKPGV